MGQQTLPKWCEMSGGFPQSMGFLLGNHGDQWKIHGISMDHHGNTHTMKKHGMMLIMKYYEIAQKHPIAATWIEKSEAFRIISQNIAYVILYKSQSPSPEHFLVIIQLENGWSYQSTASQSMKCPSSNHQFLAELYEFTNLKIAIIRPAMGMIPPMLSSWPRIPKNHF